jgi:hypothetical protein
VRYHEIISEVGPPGAVTRQRERQARARQDIASAHGKQAEAGHRYQDAVRSADTRLKSTRQATDAAQAKKRQAAAKYQDDLRRANERIARANRSLTERSGK